MVRAGRLPVPLPLPPVGRLAEGALCPRSGRRLLVASAICWLPPGEYGGGEDIRSGLAVTSPPKMLDWVVA